MRVMQSLSLALLLVAATPTDLLAQPAPDPAVAPLMLEKQKLIQEIDCSKPQPDVLFMEFPAGVSKVEMLLGAGARVLPNSEGDAKYFAYRVGEGKGLKAGAAYVLAIDYPEDRARAMYILNQGCETTLGFATGQAMGDVVKGKYVPNNPESLKYPLSGRTQTWAQYFHLHDRFPEIKRPRGLAPRPLTPADGFWVIIAQPPAFQDPLSAGAAVSRIRLYEVADPDSLTMPINYPPAGLPRRHIFSREEMADGVISTGHKPEEKDPALRGVKELADWYEYKMRVMKVLGIDTFSKDLLEFGHNQGWDSADGGGNAWVNQSSTPDLWSQVLERAAKLKLPVLPMYEYRGSIGQDPSVALGTSKRARRLDGGETYTHITWCEKGNADVVDPATLADAKNVLDVSMLKYKNKAEFLGAWFRQRPTAMPVSFNDFDLKTFSAEANDGARITRAHLQGDKALLQKYYTWWFGKRKAFFEGLRDHLRTSLGEKAFLLYTNDSSEPGTPLPRSITGEGKPNAWQWMQVVVNDDMATWEKILSDEKKYPHLKPMPLDEVISKNIHGRGLELWAENWGNWEVNHSCAPADPANYKTTDGVMLSYTYNRLYTVGASKAMETYRTPAGLALMRHYTLNENEMTVGNDEILGYFVADVERGGPYCMMAEARALAHGDPTLLGSLTGNSNKRGFPGYVRNFHAAFLALPALPSEVVAEASSDNEVVVRAIKTPAHGTYYSVVNTGFGSKAEVEIRIAGKAVDAVTGEALPLKDGKLTMSFHPAQLRALRVE